MGEAPLEVLAHDHQASILQIQRLQESLGSVRLELHIAILPPLPAMSIARPEGVVLERANRMTSHGGGTG